VASTHSDNAEKRRRREGTGQAAPVDVLEVLCDATEHYCVVKQAAPSLLGDNERVDEVSCVKGRFLARVVNRVMCKILYMRESKHVPRASAAHVASILVMQFCIFCLLYYVHH